MTEIQMLDTKEKFSIIDEANNQYSKISLSQLLDANPSIRKELEIGCKPREEKILCSIYNPNILIIIGEVNNTSLKVLFDTVSNVNLISKEGINKLNNQIIIPIDNLITFTLADDTKISPKSCVKLS